MRGRSNAARPVVYSALAAALALLLLGATWLLAAAAGARPLPVTHIPLPGNTSTNSLTVGPDGAIWFAAEGYEAEPRIGRLAADGGTTTYEIPGLRRGQLGWPELGGLTSTSKDLWFTVGGGGGYGRIDQQEIVRMAPDGKTRIFPLPTGASFPRGIAPGPRGELWFEMSSAGTHRPAIAAIDRQGRVVEDPLPKNQELALGEQVLTTGPEGDLWFLARGRTSYPHTGLIGRISPGGKIREFRVPGEGLSAIAATADGVWFADESAIGRVSKGGGVRTYPLPAFDVSTPEVDTLMADPNGDLWFTDNPPAGLGRITPSGKISFAPMATENDTHSSLISQGGYLWFNERDGVVRVNPRIVGPTLSQIGTAGPHSPVIVRLMCKQLREACDGTLRVQIQPWRRGGPEPERVSSAHYHLSRGASRTYRLRLSAADLKEILAAGKKRIPITVGAFERGGYATGSPLRITP